MTIPDATFKARVGLHPRYFVPVVGDEVSVTMSGPTGTHACTDIERVPNDEFGDRWGAVGPEPFWAEGLYRFSFDQAGETTVYEVEVGPHNGRLTKDEIRRLGELDPEDAVAALAFVPTRDQEGAR